MNARQINVGGQAVLEGVMMRAPHAMAVAVRRPDTGQLVVQENRLVPVGQRSRWARVPIVRGAVTLVESLINGFQALSFAAEQAQRDGWDPPPGPPKTILQSGPLYWSAATLFAAGSPEGASPTSGRTLAPLFVSLAVALGLFVGLPHILAVLIGGWLGGGWNVDGFGFHVLDGFFKIAIFVAYVALIARIPEIQRVFEYHGAEHKVVNTYERGRPLRIEEARLQGTFHARCGTSFVLVVLLLSVAVFAVVLPAVPQLSPNPWLNHGALLLIKVPLMAPVAGIAYELNRWSAAHPGALGVALLVAPGRWMQRLTTRDPDDAQLEVALAAIHVALHRDSEARIETHARSSEPVVRVYEGLGDLEARLTETSAGAVSLTALS